MQRRAKLLPYTVSAAIQNTIYFMLTNAYFFCNIVKKTFLAFQSYFNVTVNIVIYKKIFVLSYLVIPRVGWGYGQHRQSECTDHPSADDCCTLQNSHPGM